MVLLRAMIKAQKGPLKITRKLKLPRFTVPDKTPGRPECGPGVQNKVNMYLLPPLFITTVLFFMSSLTCNSVKADIN